MYKDAVGRRIKEPIDYLIEARKHAKRLCITLALSENQELLHDADLLQKRLLSTIDTLPVEAWESEPIKEGVDAV